MDPLVLILTAGVVILTVLYFGKLGLERAKLVRLIDKLPGPFSLPLFGSISMAFKKPRDVVPYSKWCVRNYGTLFRTWVGPFPEIHVAEPEYIEIILNSMKHIDKAAPYKFLHPWLGTGLLTSTGQKWHSHRKMITPTFHFKILEDFMEVFVEKSELLIQKLEAHVGGKGFDIYPYITRCALDIICETAMGIEIHAQQDTDSEYVKAVYDASKTTVRRLLKPWLAPDFIFYNLPIGKKYKKSLNILHSFTKRVIQERKMSFSGEKPVHTESSEEDRLIGKKKRKAFLDLLLEAREHGDKITDVELQEEVDTFMFEGHDTTTAGMNWTLFLLGNHPDIQEKVYEELKGIFQGSERSVTTRDLQEMKYLERVIKESLRLYPSVPFIFREVSEGLRLGEYEIPARCWVTFHILDTHRNPKILSEPGCFQS